MPDQPTATRVGPLLSDEELAELRRVAAMYPMRLIVGALRHIDAQADTIRTISAERSQANADVERLASGNERLVREVRRLPLVLSGERILVCGWVAVSNVPLIAEILRAAQTDTQVTR